MEPTQKERQLSTAYISFNYGIDQRSAQTLVAAIATQIEHGFGAVYLLFSTSGGSVADGMALYNTLRALPIELTMHNVGNVDSIGNAVFLAGKHRYCCKHSTFMFHGVWREMNGGQEEKALRECLASIIADQRRIGGIIADNTSLPQTEVNALFTEAQTKDAEFALKNQIVHEIRDAIVPPGAAFIPLVFS